MSVFLYHITVHIGVEMATYAAGVLAPRIRLVLSRVQQEPDDPAPAYRELFPERPSLPERPPLPKRPTTQGAAVGSETSTRSSAVHQVGNAFVSCCYGIGKYVVPDQTLFLPALPCQLCEWCVSTERIRVEGTGQQ